MTEEEDCNEWSQELVERLELELEKIEKALLQKAEALERATMKPPEEELSYGDRSPAGNSVLDRTNRIFSALRRHDRAEERALKEKKRLMQQLEECGFQMEEMQMERDVLLEQVHAYLEVNSSLRVRLEEQRCQSGTAQKERCFNLESRIRTLENDKEKLCNLNIQKEREIHKINTMLEQTKKSLTCKDAEMSNWRNEENDLTSSLRRDLQKALREKLELEAKYVKLQENLLFAERPGSGNTGGSFEKGRRFSLKRWSSMGEIDLGSSNLLEQRPLRPSFPEDKFNSPQLFKQGDSHPERDSWSKEGPGLAGRGAPDEAEERERKKESQEVPLHAQLNALRRGLFNVARKLEKLKRQLVDSGTIPEEDPEESQRALKRKARSLGSPDAEGNDCEEQKSEFKDLKNILEDAKILNAKLQTMRDEKQKVLESKEKAETKKNDESCQTPSGREDPYWNFQGAMLELRKAVRECGEEVDGCRVAEEEALRGLVSALSACVFGNLRHLHKWKRAPFGGARGGPEARSLAEEAAARRPGSAKSAPENGGGDNLSKTRIPGDGTPSPESRIQILPFDSVLGAFQSKKSDV